MASARYIVCVTDIARFNQVRNENFSASLKSLFGLNCSWSFLANAAKSLRLFSSGSDFFEKAFIRTPTIIASRIIGTASLCILLAFDYDAAKSTFGTSRTDGGTLKKSPSDLKPNIFATRLLGNVSHLLR